MGGRFGLPRTLHSRCVSWVVEDLNGVHEQFVLPPNWSALSHDEVLTVFKDALAAAHADDTALRDRDAALAMAFAARGIPASAGSGWLQPAPTLLPDPPTETSLDQQCQLRFDEEFDA